MRKLYYLSTIVLLIIFGMPAKSQDFSNKGKEFWLAYCYHVGMVNGGGAPAMTLYLTSDVATTYTVEIYGGAVISSGPIAANQVIPVVIPNAYFISTDGLTTGRTVHVTAVKPIVVYSFITRSQASAASLCLPVNVLGREYVASCFTGLSNEANSRTFITIVAVEDNTNVEIIPTQTTVGGWAANSVNVITLNKGEIYQVLGTTPNATSTSGVDLSGTKIKSIAGAGGCKRIAVFSGNGKVSIGSPAAPPAYPSTCNGGSADNLYQQLYPTSSWGKKYLTAPSSGRTYNHYRIYISDPTTNVTLNGVAIPLALFTNNYYQFYNNTPNLIVADKPVSLAQYFTSQNCPTNQNPYDPDMIMQSPVEQNINRVTLVSSPLTVGQTPPANQPHQHHVHVIMRNGGTGISSFRFDGTPVPPASWVVHPQDANYSYLYLSNIGPGNHTLVSDSGFNAYAYGYGSAETYGYSAGANVKDLYQQIGISTQFGIEPTPSVCKGSPFRFKVSLPYCADSMRWDLSGLPSPTPPQPPTQTYANCAAADSSTLVNGVPIYWYSLPTIYTVNTSGSFPISITVYSPNADGCGNEQNIDFDLNVYDPPIADFTFNGGGCVAEPVQFHDNTETPRPSYIWNWDFGDPASGAANTSTLQNPSHTFSAPGTYTVTFYTITTPGCFSATITKQVTVTPVPSASISGTIEVCQNDASPTITFTATDGRAPYTFTYNINGGPNQSVSTVTGNTATVTVPTTTAGVFTYNLVKVENTGSTLCAQPQTGSAVVTVNPLPTASVSGGVTVCKDAPSPNVTFTGAVGTAPYTFTYNINGGPNQIVTTTSGNSVTVAAPTNVAGTFTYNLVSVSDGTATACNQAQTGSTTITVNELPTAAVSGTIEVCRNAPAPLITFTGAGTTPPYTFTYNINGGASQTVTTTSGNSVTVSVPTGTPGTYVYNLLNVSDGTAQACAQAQTGSATVIVDPLPTASIAGSTSVCRNAPSPDVTFTGATGIAPYTFTYNINGGPNQIVTTTSGNSVTVPVPTGTAGTFTYNLVSVQNSGPVSCVQAQTGSVTITVNPLPTAAVSGTITVCKNAPSPNITFTGGAATPPYTFTYNINGGPNQTVTTTSGNSVTVAVPTGTAGTFTYNLVSVQESSGTACSQAQTGAATVIVNELPTANIAGTTEVCLNAPAPLVTFTGAGTTAPYTFTYNINGGPNQTVTTTTGNSVTVAVPTATAGTFTYNLVSVQDATAQVCSQAQSGSAVVVVHPLPTPDFSVSTPSCETKVLNFTDLSTPNVGTSNAWTWNFGDASPVSNLQNPTHIYGAAGVYNVSLTVTNSKGCVSDPVLTRSVTVHPQPVADAVLPEVCLSDTYAQFTDNSSVTPGSITSWLWNFGDPGSGPLNTSTLQNPQHSYSSTGNYTVTLTVTTNNGCVTTNSFPFIVNGDIPVANFNPLNPATMCSNDSISIQDASTVNFGSITKVEIYWDNVGAPGTFQTDDTPTPGKIYKHKYPTFSSPLTRTFTIRYRAYSGGTCVNDRIRTIVVNAAPQVQFNNMPDICLDAAPIVLTQASEIGGVPGSGSYSGPGITGGNTFNPASVGPGTYLIKYTYTSSAAGCVDTLSKPITVLDSASARFTYSTLNCEGSPVSFNSTSSTIPAGAGTITGWTWNFGDPGSGAANISTQQNPTHTFTGWGNYTVTLSVTTSNGCRSTVRSQTIYVNPIPRPRFSFPASSCLPSATVTFNSSASSIADGTSAAFTYLWNFDDPASGPLNTSTNSSPSHIYNTAGPFNVNLQITSGAGCVHDTTILLNTLHPQPIGSFTVDKTDVCVGAGTFTFRDNSNAMDGVTTQWNWNMDDGNTRTTAVVPNYNFSTPRTYNVSLYTINSFGCRSTSFTLPVTVHPYPVVDAGPDRILLEGGQITLEPVVSGNDLTYLWTPNLPGYFAGSNNVKNPVINGVDDITLTLTVTGRGGCQEDDQVFIKVLKFPSIPNIFSPNGDGVHDKWEIAYLNTYPGSTVDIYNRYGQLIFHSDGYNVPWDGTVNGNPVPVGTYYYIVNPKNGRKLMSGYVDVIR